MLKRFMPKSLYGRVALIVILPIFLMQSVITYVFFDRHWDTVTANQSANVAGQISLLTRLYETAPDEEARRNVEKMAFENLDISTRFERGRTIPSANKLSPFNLYNKTLDRQLRETARGGDQLLDTLDNTGPPRGLAPDSRATQRRREHQIPLADFDRKAVRRIRSGRIEIEARMDLHGMRQDEAYAALRGFLNSCHARGLRWVLIITGKGRASLDGDRELVTAGHLTAGRGVLRRSVPRWLAEPELRPIIVSYTTAATHHGGEGALYVQLRVRRMAGHPG